ncbi:hypothetical protein ARMSODRAFT_978165 [Armillaria solidipes]|uniref:Uncharacterized protein n=1 Tax=Armillaria solidipes TaxID=1076256 RepID=A0A2H3BF98_9AGAR|nr:hypothetical protein ARMSODRAFT_978165 [Armillaria solidipes]
MGVEVERPMVSDRSAGEFSHLIRYDACFNTVSNVTDTSPPATHPRKMKVNWLEREQDNLKHVEAAIYDTKLPSITPQKQDTRTLRIPVPRPMLDAKSSVVAAVGKKAAVPQALLDERDEGLLQRAVQGILEIEGDPP